MSDANLIEIAKKLMIESFGHDDYIFRQDDIGEKFYIILEGVVVGISESARYLRDNVGVVTVDKEVCRLTEGMGFGELALISGASRSLSMKAYNEVRLISLHKSEFLKCFGVTIHYSGQSYK